jgi:hypothetical protein
MHKIPLDDLHTLGQSFLTRTRKKTRHLRGALRSDLLSPEERDRINIQSEHMMASSCGWKYELAIRAP